MTDKTIHFEIVPRRGDATVHILGTDISFDISDVIAEANLSDEDWDVMSKIGQSKMIRSYFKRIANHA